MSQEPGFEGLEQDEGEKVPEDAAHAQDHVRDEPNEEKGDFLLRLNPEDIGAGLDETAYDLSFEWGNEHHGR